MKCLPKQIRSFPHRGKSLHVLKRGTIMLGLRSSACQQWHRIGPLLSGTWFMLQSGIILACSCSCVQSIKKQKSRKDYNGCMDSCKRSLESSWYREQGYSFCCASWLWVVLAVRLSTRGWVHVPLWWIKPICVSTLELALKHKSGRINPLYSKVDTPFWQVLVGSWKTSVVITRLLTLNWVVDWLAQRSGCKPFLHGL